MAKPLSSRERKLVAIGLLVAAAALVWLALVQPIAAGFESRAERRRLLLLQYPQNERLIGRIAALRRAAETQRDGLRLYMISAPDAEQGSERLKGRLEASLLRAGGELRAAESVEAPPGWVRASASAVLSNAQFVAWLDLLTAQAPYLVVETLTVNADRALNSNRLDLLDVKLETSIPLSSPQSR